MSRPQRKRSRANTAGEDGDANAPATKLWIAMEPPPIVCFSHEALVKWRKQRELYEAAVISRCQGSGEPLATVMIPAINTINRRLLKTFCELELKIQVGEMTNEKLVEAISKILSSMMNDQLPNVHVIMSQQLKMNLRRKDVKARVLNYFDRFDELIEENGLNTALGGNVKLKCKLLTDNSSPESLKEQFMLYQELDPTVKTNVSRLFDVIKTEALKNQQSFDLYQSSRNKATPRIGKASPRKNNGEQSNRKSQKGESTQSSHDGRPEFKKRNAAPAQGCLHCKGAHWVSDCPSVSDEQKKTARQAFMDQRKGAEAWKMKRVLEDDEDLAPRHAAFNGVVTMPYFPDNGSKYNVIPRRIVKEVLQLCPDVKVQCLAKPIVGKAVGGAVITCKESIQLDLELITPEGRVRMRQVTCVITETEEDEFLLGRLTLEALGIDVEGQLSALANKEIVDFDPFESEPPVNFNPPDKGRIMGRLCELINEAVTNGFPVERKRELFDVVTRYDIWRLEIGSIFEGGSLPIFKAATDLDYLLIRSKGFRLYSDHRNLIFIFAPGDEIKKHVRGKLQRWSLKLNELRYSIEHISGDDNVWADMASRWVCSAYVAENTTIKRWQLTEEHQPVELRPLRTNSEWPTITDIQNAQASTECTRPTDLNEHDGVWTDKNNHVWIPADAEVLLMRLMVIAHCGTMGHRGVKVMVNHLKDHFHIDNLEQKVREFCDRCLLCCHVKGGNIVPRPWGETYRSKERNEALHMDYLYIGEYNGRKGYILVMKDDFSHFCELIECTSTSAANAATSILNWSSRYGMPELLISDTATHFKNQLLEELCHKTQMKQSFTLAYCPWVNGSVERLNRDISQVLRVMLLEFKVQQENWAALLPLIQANLNQSPVASLANYAPAEVFIGVKASTPLQKSLVGTDAIAANVLNVENLTPKVHQAVQELRASLLDMHHDVTTAKKKQTERNKNNQRSARTVNFHVGDYVLWSRVDAKKQGNKLSVTWVGPYRVISANANSFEIEHLINANTKVVHASRLKLYADERLDVSEEILEHIANQDIYLTVEAFTEHRKHPSHTFEVLVRWEGLEPIEDSWEPVKNMIEDVPLKLQQYVDTAGDDALNGFVLKLRRTTQPKRAKQHKQSASQQKPTSSRRHRRTARNNKKA